eukprot:Awhi_evm1s878
MPQNSAEHSAEKTAEKTAESTQPTPMNESWNDESSHVYTKVVLPFIGTLSIASVRRSDLIVAINQNKIAQNEDITGLRLWDFGLELSKFVINHRDFFSGKRVIELGAGCGTLSLTLACACNEIDLTITDASSVDFLRRNVETNRDKIVARNVNIKRLFWTLSTESETLSTQRNEESVNEDTLDNMDVVIGTDIIYHLGVIEPLFATAVRLLRSTESKGKGKKSNDGVFIVGGHSRHHGTMISIREECQVHGLSLHFVDLSELKKSEGFEYSVGDFLAVMSLSDAGLKNFEHSFDDSLQFDDLAVNEFAHSGDDENDEDFYDEEDDGS